jgi:hypothetical protein
VKEGGGGEGKRERERALGATTERTLAKQKILYVLAKWKARVHRPGIEPGSLPWQGSILPLDQRCGLL